MAPKPRPSSWEASTSEKVNGRLLNRGTEISIRDHDGRKIRARFIEWIRTPEKGEWITVAQIDKSGTHIATRSFDPSRIEVVHAKKRVATRPRKGMKT